MNKKDFLNILELTNSNKCLKFIGIKIIKGEECEYIIMDKKSCLKQKEYFDKNFDNSLSHMHIDNYNIKTICAGKSLVEVSKALEG